MIRLFCCSLGHRQTAIKALCIPRYIYRKTLLYGTLRELHCGLAKVNCCHVVSKYSMERNLSFATAIHSALHTSARLQINPLLWMLIKPAGKALSIISGRSVRKWWQALPQSEKYKIKQKIYYNRYKIAGVISTLLGAGFMYFISHLQETPITKRKRYIAFTEIQFMKIAKFELDMHWEALKDLVINPADPRMKHVYSQVVQVAQKIIDSNQHIDVLKQQKWNVILIDSDEANAFVLPTGQIFVFRGMLKLIENRDQLAVILGHEIAHVVLNHAAEKVSFASVLDFAVIIIMAALWLLMPTDGLAIITQWFNNKIVKLLLELPYSRKLETEADEVGLELIARACFDVRESSSLWKRLAFLEEISTGEEPPLEWISTHPASETRAALLDELIPEAIKLRECNQCPRLPKFDPRLKLDAVKKIIQQDVDRKRSALSQGAVIKPAMIGIKSAAAAVADSAVTSKDLLTGECSNLIDADSHEPVMQPNQQMAQSNNQSAVSSNLSVDSCDQRSYNNQIALPNRQKDHLAATNKEKNNLSK